MTLFEPESAGSEELLPYDGSAVLHRGVLDADEAATRYATLLDEVPWEGHTIHVYGRTVDEPRLTAWFGDPGHRYTYSGLTLDPISWTPAMVELRSRCEELAARPFNSCLANLYRDGRDSVSWHADDEPELGPDPTIASLSLGTERRFDLRHRTSRETVKTQLPAGSVVVMSHGCQSHWDHQAPKMLRVTSPRINLTFRTIVS